MPEMVGSRSEKLARAAAPTSEFSETVTKHVRDLRHLRSPDDEPWSELAALLARGYLRLTAKARITAISEPRNPQKEVDLRADQSVHGVEESRPRRPPWRAA